MAHTLLPAHPAGALKERLAGVRYVFTDLDATMLAPGSCALKDADGAPSLALVEALIDLRRAGLEVIPLTGRNRAMIREDCRVLGFNSFIGELGGLIMYDLAADDWEYFTGEMPYDPACGLTPHEVVERTGVVQRIVERWPGRIEYYNDMDRGYRYREVTFGLRGEVPGAEAQAILDEAGLGLLWVNNGQLGYVSKPTTLLLGPGERGHGYNVLARGLDKGAALERYCRRRGIDPAEAIAVGDSASDLLVAPYVGAFVLVENGLADPEAAALVERGENVYITPGAAPRGWIHLARALLAAREPDGAATPAGAGEQGRERGLECGGVPAGARNCGTDE